MKKLMLAILSLAVSGMVYAHGPENINPNSEENEGFWQEMNQVHELMHNTSILGKKLDTGVSFEITAGSDSALDSIKRLFVDDREKLESYFTNVDVSVEALDHGVSVKLESDDESIVKRLQYSGATSIFGYLHNGVFKQHNESGFSGFMGNHHGSYGMGMMHGFDNGMGYGPDMMHGYGNGMGVGPGMMDDDGNVNNNRPGSYRMNNNQMGYGSGMM